MKSLIMEGPAKSRVIDIEIPTPGPGEVLVKMKYCGCLLYTSRGKRQ